MKTQLLTLLSALLAFGLVATVSAQPVPSGPVVWQFLTTDLAASVTQGWHETLTDLSVSGRPIRIAGKGYDKGLGTHAPGEMVFKLARKHTQFAAEVGVDDEGGPTGSVVFRVLLDGKTAFDSGLMRFGLAAKHIALDVTGVAEMRLVVTDGGDGVQGDHADWANAAVDAGADTMRPEPVPEFSTAGFFPVAGSARTVQNFNPGWRFLKADVVGAEKPDFDDATWEVANLPHGLEILGENASGGRNYQGPAWYRKRFQAAPPTAGGKLYVYFEAVMGKCTVWVNGQKVAEHFGGYLPFAAEISSLLHLDGQDNFIAVRADNSNDPTYPPGKPQNDLDFTYMGGIYRDTFLIATPAMHVTLTELSQTVAGGGVFIGVKDVSGNGASLVIRTELANDSAASRTVILRTRLETADGREVLRSEQPVALAAGATQEITQSLAPKNVRLWSPDDPYLHFIRTEIVEDGMVQDALRTRFGFRLFEMRGQAGFFVNKQFIGVKLNGVNHHQDYAYVGNAMPKSSQWRDIKLLREGGVNAIRAAHYPQAPAFYDACDEFGMLVTTANPGWQFFNAKDPVFEQRIYEDSHNLVRRDRNHPSMLLWETALNETDNQPAEMLGNMNRIAHAEYPFPGMFTVTDAGLAKSGGLDFYYGGSYDGTINSFTREYGDGGEVDNFYSQNAATRVNHEWGEGPLLKQAAIRARDLDDCYSAPPIRLGAALWCGIDHQRGYHPDPFLGGILDEFRLPRYAYYLFQSQLNPGYKLPGINTGPMLYLAHELTQSSDPDVVVYCNCDAVRLTWLGKVIGPQKPDARYRHLPHPPFTFTNIFRFSEINTDWRERTGQVEMVAEGLIGTNVAIRAVKKYPERTTGVRVTVDDAGCGLTADGSDFVPVRATIVDNKGVPKVLAEEYVYFEVEGPGEVVSSPLSHTIPVRTSFGTATVLLRAKTTPGLIRVTAYAQGLKSGEAHVVSTSPRLPLNFDAAYAAASKPPATGGQVVILDNGGRQPATVQELKEQVQLLQRKLTSKEQDLQDLRGKMKQP